MTVLVKLPFLYLSPFNDSIAAAVLPDAAVVLPDAAVVRVSQTNVVNVQTGKLMLTTSFSG